MSRTLAQILELLERLAPLHLAQSWDNVGLLIEPSGVAERAISRLLLCIDLSESVLTEAIDENADFIVAYHPPLFEGLKRLRISAAEERVVVRALEAKLPVYSPHTALDAAPDGVNDWLARAFGPARTSSLVPQRAGRLLELATAISLPNAVELLKAHLGVPTLRVASSGLQAAGGPIQRVAVCPGAGGSSFEGAVGVDLFVTGEMRHHDVLAKLRGGASVILSEHSHTERGYLPEFARALAALANGELEVLVSQRDADPLCTL